MIWLTSGVHRNRHRSLDGSSGNTIMQKWRDPLGLSARRGCRLRNPPSGYKGKWWIIVDLRTYDSFTQVTEGSIAEKAGMKIADIILCINDVPAVDLSHIQAHDVIMEAGSDFIISVIRYFRSIIIRKGSNIFITSRENHPEIPMEAQKTSVNVSTYTLN